MKPMEKKASSSGPKRCSTVTSKRLQLEKLPPHGPIWARFPLNFRPRMTEQRMTNGLYTPVTIFFLSSTKKNRNQGANSPSSSFRLLVSLLLLFEETTLSTNWRHCYFLELVQLSTNLLYLLCQNCGRVQLCVLCGQDRSSERQ